MQQQHNQPDDQEKGGKMVLKSVYFDPQQWQQARDLADSKMIPLSRVIRKLLGLWLSGKIRLDDYED
jgi:hypothetical protein